MSDREQQLRLALQRETEHVQISPRLRGRLDARLRPSGTFRSRALAVSIAAGVVAVGAIVWIVAGTRIVREDVTGPGPRATTEPEATPIARINDTTADEAFRCIVNARHYRDLDMARPCMTERWATSIADPVEFIGASSPALERATIVSSARTDDRIVYDALSYWGSNEALEFVSEDTITLVAQNGEWRADGWEHGDMVPIGETTSVALRFLALGDTPRCDGDVPAPESFESIVRIVPAEAVIDDLALSAVRELLTGAWPHEGDGAGVFPEGTRVTRVTVADGVATVELNRIPRPLERCDYGLTALRETLTSLDAITDVEVRRAPAQEPIEPDV